MDTRIAEVYRCKKEWNLRTHTTDFARLSNLFRINDNDTLYSSNWFDGVHNVNVHNELKEKASGHIHTRFYSCCSRLKIIWTYCLAILMYRPCTTDVKPKHARFLLNFTELLEILSSSMLEENELCFLNQKRYNLTKFHTMFKGSYIDPVIFEGRYDGSGTYVL